MRWLSKIQILLAAGWRRPAETEAEKQATYERRRAEWRRLQDIADTAGRGHH